MLRIFSASSPFERRGMAMVVKNTSSLFLSCAPLLVGCSRRHAASSSNSNEANSKEGGQKPSAEDNNAYNKKLFRDIVSFAVSFMAFGYMFDFMPPIFSSQTTAGKASAEDATKEGAGKQPK